MLARRKLVVMGLFILIGIFFIPMMLFSAEKKVKAEAAPAPAAEAEAADGASVAEGAGKEEKE